MVLIFHPYISGSSNLEKQSPEIRAQFFPIIVGLNRVSENRNENNNKNAHGGCFQDLEICEIKFAQGIWRGPARTFLQFSQQVSSFVRSIAVCSTTCRRDLLLQLLNPYYTISAVTALQAAAQLEVACSIFCSLRDEHLSIDRPVCPFFAWPASKLLLLASSSRHTIT